MSFKLPENTDWMIEQMQHESTRLYAEELHKCVKENKPGYTKALEIGAAWGVSTLSILLAGDGELTSVDINPKVRAHEEVRVNNFWPRWKFYHGWSKDFWADNKEKFDLVYIDGGHTYEMAHLDIQKGWQVLEKGGLFIVDDVVHKYNKEVDIEAQEPHYGVAIAVMEHIVNNNITQIGSSSKLWWTVK